MTKKPKVYTYRKYEYDNASITINSNIRKEFNELRRGKWDVFIKNIILFIKKHQKEFDKFSKEVK